LLLAFIVSTVSLEMKDVGKFHALRIDTGIEAKGISSNDYLPSKARDVLIGVGEDIMVSCPPREIEKLPTFLDIVNIVRGESRLVDVWGHPASGFVFRWEKRGADLSPFVGEIEAGSD
jgi:hypothetical protein